MNWKYKILILAFVFLFTLTGCQSKAINQKEQVKKEKHIPRKFGATYMTMNNPYFIALDNSIEAVLAANGDVLITRDPAQDQEKQNAQIKEMIEEGVVSIFVNPVDWKGIKPALEMCYEAGIPVFNIDTYVYDSKYVVSCILSDNYNAGVQIAKDVMKKKESAKIAIINDQNINSTALRVQGFLDTIEGHAAYQVVLKNSMTAELEGAMEITKQIIDEGITYDVILGGNDPTALGALAALQLRRVDLQDILIYGIDGSPDGKAMIEQGFLEGTSAQFPIEIGKTAAELAYQYLEGNEIEREIIIPVQLITIDNLTDFDPDGWQ
ncbi:LacI family transcriptional regulator [Sporanaerobium hydrogeniformans]|uniref:LacI family transcriptional regulator n=1 Tax=Sporanaerobium hydrogeniformans TaxID=3072179 RepID=A0AC61D9W1_9FIRM|nr:sugar ABC transporter substrate-binding protein [Sporanaerobium hydrogeniformans]PHV70054.1 LacI family transcriptional regulator [Sporanaerobium hydrogeniformans]